MEGDVPVLAPSLFLIDLSIHGRSDQTILNYAYRLNTYFKVLSNSDSVDWKSVNDENMTAYINGYLKLSLGLNRVSIAGHIATLSSFYDWAWNHGYLYSPSAYSFSIYEKGSPTNYKKGLTSVTKVYVDQYISDEKFDNLLSSIRTNDLFLLERNELILNLAKLAGLRRSEIMDPRNLSIIELKKVIGFSSSNNFVSIIGKGEKLRRVPILPDLQVKILKFMNGRHKKLRSKYLICSKSGDPLNVSIPNNIFMSAKRQLADSYWDTRVFHSLRHTYATNMVSFCYKNNLDPWQLIPEYMGHTNITTTLGYIAFEAALNSRHSILKKLNIEYEQIRKNV